MSGLLALLDDVAIIARLAATQIDDIAAQATKVGSKVAASVIDDAAKAGAKSLGVVIDDAAVTPKYVTGLPAARELPIVWKIARASFFNKLVILLPAALLLSQFLPWVLTPLLMLGGCYLCFEGAEKILHAFKPHDPHVEKPAALDAAHLEKQRVAGAIKTDFILSAEIMTIALSAITSDSWITQGFVLAFVAIGITALVYGTVALLVKADDVGLKLSQVGRLNATRAFGRGMVHAMPSILNVISIIGTAAMLWVGGSIVIHGLKDLGYPVIYDTIHHIALAVGHSVPSIEGALEWLTTAAIDGVFGIVLGSVIVVVLERFVFPLFKRSKAAH